MSDQPSSPPPADWPVVIVGAGFLGARVARSLVGYPGSHVRATTRSGVWHDGSCPDKVELRRLDVIADDDKAVASTLHDAKAVVICIAPGRVQAREQLYVDGTRRVLGGISPGQCRRIVYVSSTSALPDIDGPVDEDTTEWPTTERGIVQRRAEAIVLEFGRDHDVPALVLRLGGLYGPGRELGRIYRQRSIEPLAGDGWQATNLIHLDDATAAVVAALAAPASTRGIVHVCDDDHRPRRELYEAAARRDGVAPPGWELPIPADRRVRGKRVDNRRLSTMLGVTLAHPTHTT